MWKARLAQIVIFGFVLWGFISISSPDDDPKTVFLSALVYATLISILPVKLWYSVNGTLARRRYRKQGFAAPAAQRRAPFD